MNRAVNQTWPDQDIAAETANMQTKVKRETWKEQRYQAGWNFRSSITQFTFHHQNPCSRYQKIQFKKQWIPDPVYELCYTWWIDLSKYPCSNTSRINCRIITTRNWISTRYRERCCFMGASAKLSPEHACGCCICRSNLYLSYPVNNFLRAPIWQRQQKSDLQHGITYETGEWTEDGVVRWVLGQKSYHISQIYKMNFLGTSLRLSLFFWRLSLYVVLGRMSWRYGVEGRRVVVYIWSSGRERITVGPLGRWAVEGTDGHCRRARRHTLRRKWVTPCIPQLAAWPDRKWVDAMHSNTFFLFDRNTALYYWFKHIKTKSPWYNPKQNEKHD
jgi:hypothetical protein